MPRPEELVRRDVDVLLRKSWTTLWTLSQFDNLRSQNVTLNRGQNIKYLPYVFTEYGALMAANILNSARAVQMSIFVVRAFAKMREALRRTPQLARKLAALEKKLTARLDTHETAIV